jgi:hypothetical protein
LILVGCRDEEERPTPGLGENRGATAVSRVVEEERWEEMRLLFAALLHRSDVLQRAHERALASCCYSVTEEIEQ